MISFMWDVKQKLTNEQIKKLMDTEQQTEQWLLEGKGSWREDEEGKGG